MHTFEMFYHVLTFTDLRMMKCAITDALAQSEGGRGILCPKNDKVAFMKLNDQVSDSYVNLYFFAILNFLSMAHI